MKHDLSLARFLGVIAVVALLSAACAPIPVNVPRFVPTQNVLLPNVSSGSNADTSPLQPTASLTGTVAVTPTIELTATIEVPSATPAPTSTPLPTAVGPTWEWVSSTFKDGTVLAPGDPTRYTFQLLGDGNLMVQADCNFGSGTYEESRNSLTFGAIGTTKIACPPDSMDSAFLAQLRNAESFELQEDRLVITLKDRAGTMRLRKELAPTEPVPTEPVPTARQTPAVTATVRPPTSPTPLPTDTPWPATATALPEPTATEPAPKQPPTPAPAFTPTPLPVVIVRGLAASSTLDVAAVNQPLNGTAWTLLGLAANRAMVPPVGTSPVSLEVDPRGVIVRGSTGCNQYRATLVKDANGASIVAPFLMTDETCAANLKVQEVEFFDSLLRTRSYEVRGNELRLLDARGNPVMMLVRK
jgi:heat shock protein HslJ